MDTRHALDFRFGNCVAGHPQHAAGQHRETTVKIFEFKTPDTLFYVDLEHIQLLSKLTYSETPYSKDGGVGPGSGHVTGGLSEGKFSMTLLLRPELTVVEHRGNRQPDEMGLRQALAAEHKLGKPVDATRWVDEKQVPYIFWEVQSHSAEIATLATLLNALPAPYAAGRAFKAEYERLLAAWHASKPLTLVEAVA